MPPRANRAVPSGNAAQSQASKEARAPSGEAALGGKRERNKAQNRADILAAAREIFTELGYDVATIRDIIRRTRLASGTFYNYFPDKESVFRALLQESEVRRLEWLARVSRREGSYADALRRSFRAYFEFVVSDRTTFDLLRRNAETVRAFAKDAVLVDERARLEREIQSDIGYGAIPELDTAFLAASIIGVAFEVAVIMVERDPIDIDAATDFVTDLFLGLYSAGRREERAAPAAPRRRPVIRA